MYGGIEERTIELASVTSEDREGSSLGQSVVVHNLQEASPTKRCFLWTLNLTASDTSP